jgi:hypothetical protein
VPFLRQTDGQAGQKGNAKRNCSNIAYAQNLFILKLLEIHYD